MTTQSALIESRSWRVYCRCRLVIECQIEEIVRSTDELGSSRAAEAELRDRGWTIHANGSATCPVCLSLIDGTETLDQPGWIDRRHLTIDDLEALGDQLTVSGSGDLAVAPSDDESLPDDDLESAEETILRREVDGDGGLGAELADRSNR